MKKTRLGLVLVVLIILGLVGFFWMRFGMNAKMVPSGENKQTISKVVPDEVEIIKGTIAAFNNSILSVKLGTNLSKSFNISGTKDIKAVVAGSLEGDDAVTVNTSKSDLVIGKEVMVVAQKGTNTASSVYILR